MVSPCREPRWGKLRQRVCVQSRQWRDEGCWESSCGALQLCPQSGCQVRMWGAQGVLPSKMSRALGQPILRASSTRGSGRLWECLPSLSRRSGWLHLDSLAPCQVTAAASGFLPPVTGWEEGDSLSLSLSASASTQGVDSCCSGRCPWIPTKGLVWEFVCHFPNIRGAREVSRRR